MRIIFILLLLCSQNSYAAYAQLSSLVTQSPSSYKGGLVKMDQTDNIDNFELSPSKDTIIAKEAGVYFVICTATVGATSAGAKGYMDLWYIVNDKPIPNSANRIAIPDFTTISLLTSQFVIPLKAGDKLNIGFSASAPSLGFLYIQPDLEPAMSSFMLSIFNINR